MKYIIDMPKNPAFVNAFYYTDGIPIVTNITEFKPYTESDRQAIENEVWEFVRIIRRMNISDWIECFEQNTLAGIYDLDYSEAKVKHDAWKKEKEEIHVGDEVILYDNVKMVVVQIDHGTSIQGVDENGECYECIECNAVKKTGRHFDEIEELLKKMKEKSE